MADRNWVAEFTPLLIRKRRMLQRVLAGQPAGDDSLEEEIDQLLEDYDAEETRNRAAHRRDLIHALDLSGQGQHGSKQGSQGGPP